jgi:hypothetical protein
LKRRKQSAASAVIEASLQLAQEYARLIEASQQNEGNDQPAMDGQRITDSTQSVVTR